MNRSFSKTKIIVCLIVALCAFLFKFNDNYGQKVQVNSKYKSWVRVNNSTIKQPGHLYAADAKSIHFLSYFDTSSGKKELMRQEILYSDINKLVVRKRGSVGTGALIGALAGCAIGAIVGYSATSEDDFFGKDAVALTTAIIFTPFGAVIGAGIGSIRKPIMIDKNSDRYPENELNLQKYVIEQRAIGQLK